MLCQEAIHETNVAPGDYDVDLRPGRPIDSDRPAIYRPLELAAKRSRSDRAELFSRRIPFCESANRLGGGPTRLRWHRIPDPAFYGRALLQNLLDSRMDWTRASTAFIRDLFAVLLFARSQNVRRDRGRVGVVFLQLRAARDHGQPMFHAGHPVARALDHRFVFISAMDCER